MRTCGLTRFACIQLVQAVEDGHDVRGLTMWTLVSFLLHLPATTDDQALYKMPMISGRKICRPELRYG